MADFGVYVCMCVCERVFCLLSYRRWPRKVLLVMRPRVVFYVNDGRRKNAHLRTRTYSNATSKIRQNLGGWNWNTLLCAFITWQQ